jgi:hypothetical protein
MVRLEGNEVLLREWRLDEVDAMHRCLWDATRSTVRSARSSRLPDLTQGVGRALTPRSRPPRRLLGGGFWLL